MTLKIHRQTLVALAGASFVHFAHVEYIKRRSKIGPNNDNLEKEHQSHAKRDFSQLVRSPITVFNPNPNMEVAYDARTKNPLYVVERYQTPSGKLFSRKGMKKSFHEEKTLPEYHRSRNSHYRNSGYDRGHMAPAADFKSSEDHMKDTFSLINISPQTPVVNRLIWSKLEELIRKLLKDKEGYVISGPIWLPKYSTSKKHSNLYHYSFTGLGSPPGLIQVPTHFFKVVFTLTNGHIDQFAAFVVPNESFEHKTSVNLQNDFLVRLTDLEAVTGISFFPDSKVDKENLGLHRDLDFATEEILSRLERSSNPLCLSGTENTPSWRILKKRKHNKNKVIPKHFCSDHVCNITVRLKQLR